MQKAALKGKTFQATITIPSDNKPKNQKIKHKRKPKKSWSYNAQFLTLKCAPDVLAATCPIGRNIQKEISESMAIIKVIRSPILKNPNAITLYDLCAGNALTSVIAAHLLPIRQAIAVDIKTRVRHYENVDRFIYNQGEDIFKMDPAQITPGSIIISVHPCSSLAERVIEIYKESKAAALYMMPCCKGNTSTKIVPPLFQEKIGKYDSWAWHLADKCNGVMISDAKCLSPRRIIIKAVKTRAQQDVESLSIGSGSIDPVKQLATAHRVESGRFERGNC